MQTVEFLLCCCIKTRESLWNLFLEYSLLINCLIQEVISDDRFEDWRKQGKITRQVLKELCEKAKESFSETLPSRFYTSAILLVSYTFSSWFEVQKKLRLKISGKERWLQVITKDLLLSEETDFSCEAILLRAEEILAQAEIEIGQKKIEENSRSKMSFLFKELEKSELDPLDFRAIAPA